MFKAILRKENLGHNTKSYTYWSVPDNEGTEVKQVTRSFFESK